MHSEKALQSTKEEITFKAPKSVSKKIKGYPKIKRGEGIYVRYPVQIQEVDLNKTVVKLEVGKWMAVNVHLPEGYTRLIAPVQFDSEAECRKSCDTHNEYHKFTKKQVLSIISASMKASIERSKNENTD